MPSLPVMGRIDNLIDYDSIQKGSWKSTDTRCVNTYFSVLGCGNTWRIHSYTLNKDAIAIIDLTDYGSIRFPSLSFYVLIEYVRNKIRRNLKYLRRYTYDYRVTNFITRSRNTPARIASTTRFSNNVVVVYFSRVHFTNGKRDNWKDSVCIMRQTVPTTARDNFPYISIQFIV